MEITTNFTQLDGFSQFCLEIFKFLNFMDLLRLSRVNHRLYDLVRDYHLFWDKLLVDIMNAYYIVFGYYRYTSDILLSPYQRFISFKQDVYNDQLKRRDDSINLSSFYNHSDLVDYLAIATSSKFWLKLNTFYINIKNNNLLELLKYLTIRNIHNYNKDIDAVFRLKYDIYISWFYNKRKKLYHVMTKKHGLSYDVSFEEFIKIAKTITLEERRDIILLLTFLHEILE